MKIFGVGWAKTGTTTLGRCFEILGFSHYGYSRNLIGKPEQALLVARRYDSFQDWPWTIYYKELDQRFPGSKFVLTTRGSDRWLRSYRNALSKQSPSQHQAMNEARRKIYGLPFPNVTDEQLIERYEQHNSEVKLHFIDRKKDLLIVNWEQGDGWEALCGFLGKPVPQRSFPHANRGNYATFTHHS